VPNGRLTRFVRQILVDVAGPDLARVAQSCGFDSIANISICNFPRRCKLFDSRARLIVASIEYRDNAINARAVRQIASMCSLMNTRADAAHANLALRQRIEIGAMLFRPF